MKASFALALVLCVAAAAFFSPVKAEEEDAAMQLKGGYERLTDDTVEPLSRELEEVDESSDSDEDTLEGAGTELDQDPSDGMLRDLKSYGKYHRYYYPYGYKRYGHGYKSYGHGSGRRLAGYYGNYYKHKYPYYKYPYPYYKYDYKKSHGRRLASYYKHKHPYPYKKYKYPYYYHKYDHGL